MAVKEKAKEAKKYVKDVEIIEPTKKKEKNEKVKKDNKNVKKKEVKPSKKSGVGAWFKSVIRELKNVKWPTKKEMIKNSVATIVFILFFSGFFLLIEVLMSLVLEYFG